MHVREGESDSGGRAARPLVPHTSTPAPSAWVWGPRTPRLAAFHAVAWLAAREYPAAVFGHPAGPAPRTVITRDRLAAALSSLEYRPPSGLYAEWQRAPACDWRRTSG